MMLKQFGAVPSSVDLSKLSGLGILLLGLASRTQLCSEIYGPFSKRDLPAVPTVPFPQQMLHLLMVQESDIHRNSSARPLSSSSTTSSGVFEKNLVDVGKLMNIAEKDSTHLMTKMNGTIITPLSRVLSSA
ncbi:unnamed protein product [Clavelina lepadiformis]|uniref:Uncharacterized protein n=1 Tax=Clavelina lepadiformis TaxID=159417 RepID=A0ABP0GEL6_CLALP